MAGLSSLVKRMAGGQSAAASGHRRRVFRCSMEEGIAGQTIPCMTGESAEPMSGLSVCESDVRVVLAAPEGSVPIAAERMMRFFA